MILPNTQPPIGYEHVTGLSGRMDGLHVGQVMGQQRCDDELQEHTGTGMEQS